MREIRLSGSEGGAGSIPVPTPSPKPSGRNARATWPGLSSPGRGDGGSPVVACRVEPRAEHTEEFLQEGTERGPRGDGRTLALGEDGKLTGNAPNDGSR